MADNQDLKKNTISGFFWRISQNFGSQFINFGIQVVLARLLLPETYGIIALTAIFSAIAGVIIQGTFSAAVIQRKNISQLELSSVFFLGILISVLFYILIFVSSPAIASYYDEPLLKAVLRIQSLNLLIGSLYSTHQALLMRNMEYKKGFASGVLGTLVQGVVGITLAFTGYGVWALVYSSIANNLITFLTIIILVKWRPTWEFSLKSVKILFSYSSKIFLIGIMNAIYTNLLSLFIGKIYDSKTLGYYNKGYSFPSLIMVNVDGAMNTVLFSSLSSIQDNPEGIVKVLRRSMKMSLFISAPAMLGLVAVAEPLIALLLTDKWLPSVPFLRLVALGCLVWPLSARMQAINAVGRSDIALKLNIVLRTIGIALLIFFARFDIYILVLSTFFGEIFIAIVLSFIIDKLIGYKIKDQMKDIFPSILIASVMAVLVYSITFLGWNNIYTLAAQLATGFISYIALAWIFKMDSLHYLINTIKSYLPKLKNRSDL